MKTLILILLLSVIYINCNGQRIDTVIAFIPRHFSLTYFEKKITPDDFFVSKNSLYFKNYERQKLKNKDSVIYYDNFILKKSLFLKQKTKSILLENGITKVFLGK